MYLNILYINININILMYYNIYKYCATTRNENLRIFSGNISRVCRVPKTGFEKCQNSCRGIDQKRLQDSVGYNFIIVALIKVRYPLDDFMDDCHKVSRRHMRSGKFLIAASKNFAGRKIAVASSFRRTILFAEVFDQ